MAVLDEALAAFTFWFAGLERFKQNGGMPAKGTLAGALIILERLQTEYQIEMQPHLTRGGGQVKGVSGKVAARILARYGEQRHFIEEARTNRGLIDAIGGLLTALRPLGLDTLAEDQRNAILSEMQRRIVEAIQRVLNQDRLRLTYDASKSTWHTIRDFLASARGVGRDSAVAEYLIGAKLQLRFPDHDIRNSKSSTSDVQHGESGDFQVGETVFHVSVRPNEGHYAKCKRNLDAGLRVYMLVPEEFVMASRATLEVVAAGRVAVQSIESFISQNIEELGEFDSNDVKESLTDLLHLYNQRVREVEPDDESKLIAIPKNLRQEPHQPLDP